MKPGSPNAASGILTPVPASPDMKSFFAKIHPLRPPHARIVMAVAALVGAFASAYLLDVYLTGGPIVCGIDGSKGCDVVRASSWAYVFGVIPRPALGLFFYTTLFVLLCVRTSTTIHADRLRQLTHVWAAIGVFESIYLVLIQAVAIKAYCLWCITSAVCAFVIGAMAVYDRKEEVHAMSPFREMRVYLLMFLVFAPIASLAFWFLTRTV